MSDFEAWLSNLEREVERLPVLHGDHAGVKAELRRLVADARGGAGAPFAPEAASPGPAPPAVVQNVQNPEPAPEPATEPAPAPSDEQPQ